MLKKQNKKVKVKQIVGDKCYRRVEYLYQTKDELVRNTRFREELKGEKTRENFREYLYTNWKSGHEEYVRINGQKDCSRNNGHEEYVRRKEKNNEKTVQLPKQEGEKEDINELFGKMNISNGTTSMIPESLINCTLDGGTPYNMWMSSVNDKQEEVIVKSLMFDRINTSERGTCKTPASDTNRKGGRTNFMERGYSREKTFYDFTF